MRNKTYIYMTKNETMKTLDNRESIFELEEIYKYKDLIALEGKETIKSLLYRDNNRYCNSH